MDLTVTCLLKTREFPWVMSHQSGFVLHCRLAKSESLSGVRGHIPAEVMIALSEVIMQMLTSRNFQRLCGHLVQCQKFHVGRNEKHENNLHLIMHS